MNNCKNCEIITINNRYSYIEFCELHASALLLYNALKDMIEYLDNNGKETDVSELARYAIEEAEKK